MLKLITKVIQPKLNNLKENIKEQGFRKNRSIDALYINDI